MKSNSFILSVYLTVYKPYILLSLNNVSFNQSQKVNTSELEDKVSALPTDQGSNKSTGTLLQELSERKVKMSNMAKIKSGPN